MTALGAAAVLAITAVSVYMLWEKPPATAADNTHTGSVSNASDTAAPMTAPIKMESADRTCAMLVKIESAGMRASMATNSPRT